MMKDAILEALRHEGTRWHCQLRGIHQMLLQLQRPLLLPSWGLHTRKHRLSLVGSAMSQNRHASLQQTIIQRVQFHGMH
jgi:hypothetical protein